jgi:hypothetical protein
MSDFFNRTAARLREALGEIPQSVYGYPVRKPTPSEDVFFALNPNVGGYAAEDNSIVLNSGSKLSNKELSSVASNEALRLLMRENDINPSFKLTNEQKMAFQGTPYATDEKALKQSIVARIATGDPSAGKFTKEQKDFADSIWGFAKNK